ncbi:MAG: O-antigen ligase family protein, partial [Candidatus Nealsonbacteria bacterium]|nr:O-antigen ligase family protein [Candidatus Nealsonbacteria bacterium]
RQFIVTQRETRAVVVVMIALATGIAGYGLYQHECELPADYKAYMANPDGALEAAGLDYPPGSPERQLFEQRLKDSEPFATFTLANSLAGFLVPWLVVAVGIGVLGLGGLSRKRLEVWIGVGVGVVVIGWCLALTQSRSACLAAGLGLVAVLSIWLIRPWIRQRTSVVNWKLPVGVAVGVVVLLVVVAAGLQRQVFSEARKSLGYRLEYWQSTMQMIGDRPLLGCGPGNFQNAYTAYKLPAASEEVADPHNFLLEVWATAGTPAMLALLAVLGCFVWKVSSLSLWERAGVSKAGSPFTSPHPNPLPEGEGTDAAFFVLGGALAGVLLSIPLRTVVGLSSKTSSLWIGLPLAAVCIALLYRWVANGRMPRWLPAVGVGVLLINLLAAGGIGFPGVAGTFWLLLAVGLNTDRPRPLPRAYAVAGLAAAITLAVTCYLSAYEPVLRSQTWMQRARWEPDREEAKNCLVMAAAADPLAAEPWRELAREALYSWQQAPNAERFSRFELLIEMALRRAPKSSSAWAAAGESYWQAFQTKDRAEHAEKAAEAYARAVELYPNSGPLRARLALAHRAAGESADFRRQAEKALWLDRITPHTDKKLPEDLRTQLQAELRK